MKTNHIIAVSIFSLLTIVLFAGEVLMSSHVSADTEVIDEVSLTVPVACTMGGVGTDSHNASMSPGTYSGAAGNEYENGIGKTTLTVFCNDSNGFSIYAIGYTNDLYEGDLHTKLVGQNTNQTIDTKPYESGDTSSNWSMKINKVDNPVSGDPIVYNPQNMNVVGSFNTWQAIPDVYTKVAEYHSTTTDPATTDTTLGAKIETTYATYISSTQAADTYTGQVKYTMVHPYNYDAPEPPSFRVFYTGRPFSTEPGHENPVYVRMTDLPESGTYNMMGTEYGSYDKLTPETLYGGYYIFKGSRSEFMEFAESHDVYDGTNYYLPDLSGGMAYTMDASNLTPTDGTIYIIKEVPEDVYLDVRFHYLFHTSTLKLMAAYYMNNTDDLMYRNIGFDIAVGQDGTPEENPVTHKRYTLTIRTTKTENTYTPASINPLATGAKNRINDFLEYTSDQKYLVPGNYVEAVPYWITPDWYKVTGAHKLVINCNDLTTTNFEQHKEATESTIRYTKQ